MEGNDTMFLKSLIGSSETIEQERISRAISFYSCFSTPLREHSKLDILVQNMTR